MGCHLNCLDEPVFITGPKPMQTVLGIVEASLEILGIGIGVKKSGIAQV